MKRYMNKLTIENMHYFIFLRISEKSEENISNINLSNTPTTTANHRGHKSQLYLWRISRDYCVMIFRELKNNIHNCFASKSYTIHIPHRL